MKETNLWNKLRPLLNRRGMKFQKISDRFTPGIPDVLGSFQGCGFAIELKQLSGSGSLKTKFRPGQLDWLRDWENSGGISMIVSTYKTKAFITPWKYGTLLEDGCSLAYLERMSMVFQGPTKWKDLADGILTQPLRRKYGPEKNSPL